MSKYGTPAAEEVDRLMRQFRVWEAWEKVQLDRSEPKRFTMEMPPQFLEMIEYEADIRGMPRQSLIKFILWQWLVEIEHPKVERRHEELEQRPKRVGRPRTKKLEEEK